MRSRDRAGLALAPLFLRFALALTFVWAGLGKLMVREMVSGDDAAILANYGVLPNPHAPQSPRREAPATPELKAPDPDAAEPPSDPGPQSATTPRSGPDARGNTLLASFQEVNPDLATAADFPEPVPVKRYALLVLGLHHAAHPGLSAKDSAPLMRLWPDFDPKTDFDPWPVRLAWAVSLTELVGGILIGVGLLTRLGALGVGGVMIGAIWLTTIGPAIQSGETMLAVLPKHDAFDGQAWTTPLFQLTLLCSALALFFAGPGTLSLDRLLVGGPPKPPPPKPPAPPPAKK